MLADLEAGREILLEEKETFVRCTIALQEVVRPYLFEVRTTWIVRHQRWFGSRREFMITKQTDAQFGYQSMSQLYIMNKVAKAISSPHGDFNK